ncbi:MAG TPA: hypothetical protein VK190_04680 [Pseudoneobacillus sp.]|nr:hypothetical protein [Pseudoneobacillus sp.]
MKKLNAEQAVKIKEALALLNAAAQELSNVLDETGYQLSESAPEFLINTDDFAYEIMTFVEDELDVVIEKTNPLVLVHSA